MKDDRQIFVEWLKRFLKMDGGMTGVELAKKAGINPGTLSGYIIGRSKGPRTVLEREKICQAAGVNYAEIINSGRAGDDTQPTVSGSPLGRENGNTTPYDKAYSDHINVVKQFKERALALEANQILLEIEQVGGKRAVIRATAALLEVLDAEKPPGSQSGRKTPEPSPKQKNGTDGH
jgi:transcriptional regulator with XRE-family HTH domain